MLRLQCVGKRGETDDDTKEKLEIWYLVIPKRIVAPPFSPRIRYLLFRSGAKKGL